MVFINPFDGGPYPNGLRDIAQQIAHHAHTPRMLQLNQHHQVGTMSLQDRMGRVPDPFPTVDRSPGWNLDPIRIELVAGMAKPFGAELPGTTRLAALDQKAFLA